jgi:glycerophosphoryl diester phosphodiesterase
MRPHGCPLLLGHRGARRYAPENTLTAFDLALEHGCDGFELDVRLTRDSAPVLAHDARLAGRSVRRSSRAILDARVARKGAALATLDDVLARYRGRAWLDIELKVLGLEDLALEAVRRHGWTRDFCISSFRLRVIEELRARDPQVPLGFLTDKRWRIGKWDRYDTQVVIPHYRLVSRQLVEEVHAAGRTLIAWTVNSPRRMRALADLGVDGIISDDTATLRKTLGA